MGTLGQSGAGRAILFDGPYTGGGNCVGHPLRRTAGGCHAFSVVWGGGAFGRISFRRHIGRSGHVAQNNPDEYEAIVWLRNQADDRSVVLEATGGQYSDFARVSANSGVPTVLGWAGHEYQWRGNTTEPVAREQVINAIYTQPDWAGVPELLDQYGITYIYVGDLSAAPTVKMVCRSLAITSNLCLKTTM